MSKIKFVEQVSTPSTPPAGTILLYTKTDGKIYILDDVGTETDLTSGGGGGEANTASNQGTGIGVFDNKNGVDLELRSLVSQNGLLTIGLDAPNKEVDFTVNEGIIDHGGIAGLNDDDHTQYILVAGTRAFTGAQSMGNNDLTAIKTGTFNSEIDNGNSGASATINWNSGQKQRITLTANATLAFTAPPGPCNLLLKVIQDGTGNRDPTWPAAVLWPGGNTPNLTNQPASVDIISLYYDGTNYYSVASLSFS